MSAARGIGVLSATTWRAGSRRSEAPLTYDYGRYTRLQTGRLSQGPVIAAAARAAKRFELTGSIPPVLNSFTADRMRQTAFADREKFYGDPKFTEIPSRPCCRTPTTTSAAKLNLEG